MRITEETKDYLVASSCPLCSQVGYRDSVLLSKIKDENGEWHEMVVCKMCCNIFNIKKEGGE